MDLLLFFISILPNHHDLLRIGCRNNVVFYIVVFLYGRESYVSRMAGISQERGKRRKKRIVLRLIRESQNSFVFLRLII